MRYRHGRARGRTILTTAPPARNPHKRANHLSTPEPGPPVILVVEDIDWIRAGMRRSLGRYGFRVVEAADASHAIEIARRERVDLILTEEELPTFDALLALALELAADRRAPVVVVNPDADGETRYGDAVIVADYAQLRTLLPAD